MIGIYKITSPSNKIYIGQSVNIEKRFIGYKRMYVKNKKQIKLHRSFLKYGVVNHIFEIVQECLEQELNNYERYYQELYNCLNNGLNCVLTKTNDKSGKVSIETLKKMSEASMGNQNWLGKKHTQETKDKISLTKTGIKFTDEINKSKGRKGRVSNRKGIFSEQHPRSIKVLQFDLDNKFVKEWNCLMDIKRELDYNISSISLCINDKLKTYKKFKWKRKVSHIF
jgi:group I intron endonuclease